MAALPLFSTAGVATLLSLLSYLNFGSAQTVPGAQLLTGGGAPGSAAYELVDLYDGSSDFFEKFNYYSVSAKKDRLGGDREGFADLQRGVVV